MESKLIVMLQVHGRIPSLAPQQLCVYAMTAWRAISASAAHLYTLPSFSMPLSAQLQCTASPSLAAMASGRVLRPRRKEPT